MQKQAPTVGRVLIMAAFTLSCFGLLLYLWSAFGGPVPLKPRGYQFTASFDEATQLAQEADVRIAGVTVGKVKKIELGDDGRTRRDDRAQGEIRADPSDSPRDPAPEDAARRDLRRDDAGHAGRRPLAEDGTLDTTQRRLDRRARRDLPRLRQEDAPGVPGLAAGGRAGDRGQRRQLLGRARRTWSRSRSTPTRCSRSSTRRARDQDLIRNTGEFFKALTEREQELAELIVNSNRVFRPPPSATSRSGDLHRAADLHRRVEEDAATARVLRGQHQPADHRPAPVGARGEQTLPAPRSWRPTSTTSCRRSGRAITASKKGLPAGESSSTTCGRCSASSTRSCATSTRSCAGSASTRGSSRPSSPTSPRSLGYNDRPATTCGALRLSVPVNPETLAVYPRRIGPNRANPYIAPGGYDKLRSGLEMFDDRNCANGGYPDARRRPRSPRTCATASSSSSTRAPTASRRPAKQAPFTTGGETTQYPHVREDAKPAP